MARWHDDERWTGERDRYGEEERRWRGERGGEAGWRGREWPDWRGEDRPRSEARGEESRGEWRGEDRPRGEWRGEEWRGGERYGVGRSEPGRERWPWREEGGEEWRGGGGGDWRRERSGHGARGGEEYGRWGERSASSPGWRGEGGASGRGEYSTYGSREGERGWSRDEDREFGRSMRRWGDEEDQGPFERMGERIKEGFRKLTGRGPKGYKRSDERIKEDVSERIARSWVNAEDVEVKVESGEVTLTGFVSNRQEKRALEDISEEVFGVEEVHNHVRMRRDSMSAAGTTEPQGRTMQPGTQQTVGTVGSHSQPSRH